jgi:methionine sulfoxide reductase catalytic subunit
MIATQAEKTMHIIRRDPNAPLSSDITPESIYLNRRELILALGATPLLGLAGCAEAEPEPKTVNNSDSADGFKTKEPLTSFRDVTNYNNFYEFGTDKTDPAKYADRFVPKPWSVQIAGHAERVGRFPLETLLKIQAAEERIYRLRCVEGWSMVIPWSGIPLAAILKFFKPTSKAKYVAFTTLADQQQMPGVAYASINWPYREGLRIDEAMHPLTILATGLYGKTLPNQNGAPLRLVVPWKYGFKSIKSIVKIEFVEKMPYTSWNALQPSEYGFFSNVNPDVDHPRWSQKTERRIAGNSGNLFAQRIATRPFNGYASQVASLYQGMDLKKWY